MSVSVDESIKELQAAHRYRLEKSSRIGRDSICCHASVSWSSRRMQAALAVEPRRMPAALVVEPRRMAAWVLWFVGRQTL